MSTVRISGKEAERAVAEVDWDRLRGLDDSEIARATGEDPEAAPLMDARTEAAVLAQRARKATGLGQAAFAKRFGLSVGTVRDWEQGRHTPGQAAQALLKLILAMPRATAEAMERRESETRDKVPTESF